MPLSNNEKSARHRAKVNADPVARARYLAKRRESYQRRKREGKTKHPPVAELTKSRQEELRQKWRRYQRSRRSKIRNLPLQCSSQVEMNSQWQQDFAPYSPSSEVDSSSATLESPVNSDSWMKQEPETVVIQWDNVNKLPAATETETEQDNTPSSATSTSTVRPPIMEDLPSGVMLTITKLHCLLESKQERIEALERQVQDLQEDRRFLRSQIENLTRALSVHVCRGISDETTGKS
ncbi:uncharacterized protein LOC107687542 [Sinocyclocheilus anshuiensis]|uniref:uncharacterized protein LOC107687542 n=1 Tax=Sinocyclocheilus anshuiensis TaxID=1608454 RepID=UPI0007B8E19F|nr:PREDICTED: uncharacterized protein LOC107687542 [Sinocyclocheilus anshuiensis]